MNSGVFIENASDLLNCPGSGLGRVAGMHDRLRLDALDVRALVLDDSIIAGLDRSCAFYRNNRVNLHAGGNGQRREGLQKGAGCVHVVERGGNGERSSQQRALSGPARPWQSPDDGSTLAKSTLGKFG